MDTMLSLVYHPATEPMYAINISKGNGCFIQVFFL